MSRATSVSFESGVQQDGLRVMMSLTFMGSPFSFWSLTSKVGPGCGRVNEKSGLRDGGQLEYPLGGPHAVERVESLGEAGPLQPPGGNEDGDVRHALAPLALAVARRALPGRRVEVIADD